MKLLLFGNSAVPGDALALKVGARLAADDGHEALHLEDPLRLLDLKLDEYVILDVAEGTAEVRLIEDTDRLSLGRLCSLHDFDMAYFLKLLKIMGKAERVRIIAIPMNMEEEAATEAVRKLLSTL